jgi:hypothetical protein
MITDETVRRWCGRIALCSVLLAAAWMVLAFTVEPVFAWGMFSVPPLIIVALYLWTFKWRWKTVILEHESVLPNEERDKG